MTSAETRAPRGPASADSVTRPPRSGGVGSTPTVVVEGLRKSYGAVAADRHEQRAPCARRIPSQVACVPGVFGRLQCHRKVGLSPLQLVVQLRRQR